MSVASAWGQRHGNRRLHSDRRNGWIVSTTSPQYNPSFELNKQTTLNAERYGFDFALSMIKLRGFGGESGSGTRTSNPSP
jgi:hypothetical protein